MVSSPSFARLWAQRSIMRCSAPSAVMGAAGGGCLLLSTSTFCEKQATAHSNRLVARAISSTTTSRPWLSSSPARPQAPSASLNSAYRTGTRPSCGHPQPAITKPWRLSPSCTSRRLASSSSSKAATPNKVSSSTGTSTTSSTTTATSTTASEKAGSSTSTNGGSLLEWYEGHLQARPVVTKMFTGSFLWGVGDAVAQIVPAAVASGDDDKDTTTRSQSYDWPRTGRAALFGFALHAPASHVHFNFLEWLTHRVGVTGLSIPVFKAFMEQFVYWSWFSNSLYHGAMGAMQGQNLQQIYNKIADVLWETQKAQWVFWIPVQLLNFRFVPVRHQLNVVLLTSIVWTALLSAWYPPEPQEKEQAAAPMASKPPKEE